MKDFRSGDVASHRPNSRPTASSSLTFGGEAAIDGFRIAHEDLLLARAGRVDELEQRLRNRAIRLGIDDVAGQVMMSREIITLCVQVWR